MTKGRDNPLYRHGGMSGWTEYRYGVADPRPISLAGRRPIRSDAKRKHLVSRAMDILRDWRLSPFEFEAPVQQGMRSSLCLQGHSWARSDAEASLIVSHALNLLGAERPDHDEGQAEWSDSPDYCSWCRGPTDDDDRRTGKHKYCSTDCAKKALAYRSSKDETYRGRSLRAAQRAIDKSKAPPKPCGYCGKSFQSDREDARFCSPVCSSRWQKGDLLLKDIVCEGCGKTCKPSNRGAKYCSHSCASADRHRLERERLASDTRICRCCGDGFTPTTEGAMYCSKRCSSTAASRLYNQRNRAEHHLVCKCCGGGFVSKMPWALYCTPSCRDVVQKWEAGKVRRLTMPVFDYMLRKNGVRITAEVGVAA